MQVQQVPLTLAQRATLAEALAILSEGLGAALGAQLIGESTVEAAWEAGQMRTLLSHGSRVSHQPGTNGAACSGSDASGPDGSASGRLCRPGASCQNDLIRAVTAMPGSVAGEEAQAWCLQQILNSRYESTFRICAADPMQAESQSQ